jgi:hypothetical protein
LPDEYLELLRAVNGGEGPLAIENPGWFQLWRAEDVLKCNEGYQVGEWFPGCFFFGSSGGGMFFAFKRGSRPAGRVLGIPFDSIDPRDQHWLTNDFRSFVRALARDG